MKRFLAIVLCIALVLSISNTAFASDIMHNPLAKENKETENINEEYTKTVQVKKDYSEEQLDDEILIEMAYISASDKNLRIFQETRRHVNRYIPA